MKRRYWLCGVLFLLLIGGMIYRTQFVIWDLPVKPNPDVAFEWLIEPVYEEAMNFQDEVTWVMTERTGIFSGLWSLIDLSGDALMKNFEAQRIMPYSEGYAYALHKQHDGFTPVFIDTCGSEFIPEYLADGNFSSGLAPAHKDNLYGFIDHNGQPVIPFQYEWASGFAGNLGGVLKNGKYGFINKKSETIVDFVFDFPSRDISPVYPKHKLQAVKSGDQRGLLNDKGKWVAEPIYERLYVGEDPLIGLQKDGKVGFINLSGDIVIDFQFPGMPIKTDSDVLGGGFGVFYRFSEGKALILFSPDFGDSGRYSGYGVINMQGELLFKFSLKPHGIYSEGYVVAQDYKNQKNGLIDTQGNWIPLPKGVFFRQSEGMAEIKRGILRVATSQNKQDNDFKYGYLKINKDKIRSLFSSSITTTR